jgi:hypothetical protein
MQDTEGFNAQFKVGQLTPIVPTAEDMNRYPDIQFNLQFEPFDDVDPVTMQRFAVASTLVALTVATTEQLTGLIPDHVLPAFRHADSPNKLRRFERFMSAALPTDYDSPQSGKPQRRRDIVDTDLAATTVLQELAASNHPVFQVVDLLQRQFEDGIGAVATEDVVKDVITLTQFSRYQAEIAAQLEQRKPTPVNESFEHRPGLLKGRTKVVGPNPGMDQTVPPERSFPWKSKRAAGQAKTPKIQASGSKGNASLRAVQSGGAPKPRPVSRSGHNNASGKHTRAFRPRSRSSETI